MTGHPVHASADLAAAHAVRGLGRRRVLAGGIAALAGGCATRRPEAPDRWEQAAMARHAVEFMAGYDVPGLSVAILHAGVPLYEGAFGMADRERGEKLLPGHRMRIASVSKTITAAAIYRLAEEGRLALEALVWGQNGLLGAAPAAPYLDEVTVSHLLTHTAGGWPNDATDPMFRNPGMGHAELIAWTLRNVTLQHRPGTRYAYSNFGYCLLGRIIERVSGKSYAEHIAEVILRPFGLASMRIAGNTLAERGPQEVRYYGQGGEDPYGMNVARMDAHGGWVATAGDLARFATCIDGFPDTPQFLRRDTITRMVAPSGADSSYASGLRVNARGNWWHTGNLPGVMSIMVRTSGNFCWAGLANTRAARGAMAADLDATLWRMVRSVGGWEA